MAAVTPQKVRCEIGSYYPAGTLVKPPLRQYAEPLPASVKDDKTTRKRTT